MERIIERCAGLDVHRDTVVATVRVPAQDGGRRQETRTFGTTTTQLLELSEWLVGLGVTLAGMEATGVYWKPVFWVLEDHVECWLLNAKHLRHVPGRKTDVGDSAWIAQLVEHGLVRPSFVPPKPIRELRDLTRYRRSQIEERTRVVQRLEKVLQDAGIKLTSVASRILSVSGRDMLEAMLAGERDPQVLAGLARGRMREKIPQLADALAGRFRSEHHGLMLAQMLAHVDFLDASIEAITVRIDELMVPFAPIRTRVMTIPGVKARTADQLIAECGVDMDRFPTAAHLASWAGVCPGNNASGGKQRKTHTRPGNKWLRHALTEAAKAASRSKMNTYLASRYGQLRGRRGGAKATGAIRHDLIIAYWHIVKYEVDYHDLGADWLASRNDPQHRTRRLVRQLEALGHTVHLDPAA
jgi:transposase